MSCPGGLQFLNAAGFRLSTTLNDGETQEFAILAPSFPAENLALASDLLEQVRYKGGAAALGVPDQPALAFDRCTRAFLPAVDGPDPARFADLAPSFFEVSGAEAMAALNAAAAKRDSEAVLRTKAMREKESAVRKRHYKRALLRVRFADGTILQGFFRPRPFPSQCIVQCLPLKSSSP